MDEARKEPSVFTLIQPWGGGVHLLAGAGCAIDMAGKAATTSLSLESWSGAGGMQELNCIASKKLTVPNGGSTFFVDDVVPEVPGSPEHQQCSRSGRFVTVYLFHTCNHKRQLAGAPRNSTSFTHKTKQLPQNVILPRNITFGEETTNSKPDYVASLITSCPPHSMPKSFLIPRRWSYTFSGE